MQQWEYLSKFVESNINNEAIDMTSAEMLELDSLPRYSPLTMIPELNQLGAKGWELVHMEPVVLGSNHDVLLIEGGGMKRWARNYFCVFKRPI